MRCLETPSARQAFHLGLQTVVLADCVSSWDPGMHAATPKDFAQKFGRVLDSRALAAEMAAAT